MSQRLLHVTSPHMKGDDVRRLQYLLNAGNIFHGDYLQGPTDGDFGPESGRACARGKFWFGYPLTKCEPTAGELFHDLLAGKVELPASYKATRARRLKAAKEKPLRLKALERAEKDLGMKEHPAGSNICPISEKWGVHGPWCCMSVSEWYLAVGSKAFILHRDFAYVPYMLAAAERGLHGLSIVRANYAQPGDIWCADWDDDGVPDHTGLLRSKVSGSSFGAIEGNTSSDAHGNQSNGGEVCHKTRSLSDVATYNRAPAFVRVGR
jgi:hypothetical protein